MTRFRTGLLPLLMLLLGTAPVLAQEAAPSRALNVFLDCDRCDNTYIRQEVNFVNYVRDRTDAQVHLLITQQNTGGGRAYTLNFIGREGFEGLSDTLRYNASSTDTDDERRTGLVRVIKQGLVRFVARTPQANLLTITYTPSEDDALQTGQQDDPWNFWVFRVGMSGAYEAEETTNFFRASGDVNANRTTEDWKIRLGAWGSYRENNFEIEDSTITSINRNGNMWGSVIRSLGTHWGAGVFSNLRTSTFNNTDLASSLSAAIEYNIFPYTESTQRELRISYTLGLRAFDYEEITVFDRLSETLLEHALRARLDMEQPWGEASASLEGSSYLVSLSERRAMTEFYSVELDGFVQMRLVRGLSVFVNAEVEWIKDQLSLPAADASEEDILLRNRRLPTAYQYEVSLGFSYTFGSIYNNVINARFGS